ncbi:MAG: Pr6Pr family membrane protein [Mucilaginibacter sp.]|nr:Pr6Pr family membrane protein [Mucilaginibacter sp.]
MNNHLQPQTDSNNARVYSAIVSLVTIFALALQFVISLQLNLDKGRPLGYSLEFYFSFFTIQCNLLVAFTTAAVALGGFSNKFFARPGVLTATAVYITIVCIVYNLVLRGTVYFTGWGRVADELLHVVDPILFIVFWFVAVPKQSITYKGTFSWLWYPLLYIIYVLIRGVFTARYPYFFLDTVKYGYPKVAVNIAILVVVFWLFCLMYAFIAQRISLRKKA